MEKPNNFHIATSQLLTQDILAHSLHKLMCIFSEEKNWGAIYPFPTYKNVYAEKVDKSGKMKRK